ncbi:Glucosyltransferase-Alg8p [Phaffia rhodozyma]|uniref:Alpha-1,3-glucosyltransferase n=1 Tax=Phaffia rhodozyma TaxID=264483 RepID=A0A0F7SYB2_PHARH|nr:Glucosyltransferase-Alg8p [Phaffia rhodozyma]
MAAQSTTRPHPSASSSKSRSRWASLFLLSSAEKDIFVLSSFIKLLLIPSYRSTDFEVHRNWLAITHQLPLLQWYYDNTSEWSERLQSIYVKLVSLTLVCYPLLAFRDYPPFFAHFEHFLSNLAYVVDPAMVQLANLGYASPLTIIFQRLSVIVTESMVLGTSLLAYVRTSKDPETQLVLCASLLMHPAFLIVDHIHFQYNGFMFGILIWSMWFIKEGNHLAGAALFAVLLNFKHIYIYLAPPYFVYLLRSYCFSSNRAFLPRNLIKLGSIVVFVFFVSLGPFLRDLPQLGKRLFPFTRGLNHAYWAGNVWALVTFFDRTLLKFGHLVGLKLQVDLKGVSSSTRGFVGDTVFAVLPDVKPIHCFVITVALQFLFSLKLWRSPTYKTFVWALTLSGFTSFLFGWHVHEKAVLLFLTPLTFLATENYAFFRVFVIASASGIVSLFPLLFTPSETPIKLIYSALWFLITFAAVSRVVYRDQPAPFSRLKGGVDGVLTVDADECVLRSGSRLELDPVNLGWDTDGGWGGRSPHETSPSPPIPSEIQNEPPAEMKDSEQQRKLMDLEDLRLVTAAQWAYDFYSYIKLAGLPARRSLGWVRNLGLFHLVLSSFSLHLRPLVFLVKMKDIVKSQDFVIPEGVTVAIKSRIVKVSGPRGELTKNIRHVNMDIQLTKKAGSNVVSLAVWHGARKHLACLRTVRSLIENMITGVTKGFLYKMRAVYAHFPINCIIGEGGRSVSIRNFLGEKIVREIPMLEGVTISESKVQKDEIIIEGNDIQNVSQSCATIHGACLVKNKDIRKFLDGLYVSEKTTVVQDE